jgi:pimeloyl-ACP methyl ester carboxylesterase
MDETETLPGPPPTPIRHRYATASGGVRLHYVEAEPHATTAKGTAKSCLLLHGFPEFWYTWRHQIPALAAAGFRALAPDQRGYNLSDKPAGVESYRVHNIVEDAAELIRQTGRGRAFVVGHDWGGAIAWAVAIHHPELVEKLVVINGAHPAAYMRELRTLGQLRKSWYVFFFQLPRLPEWAFGRRNFGWLERVMRRDPVRPGAFSEEDIRAYKEALAQPGALTATINWYRAVGRHRLPADAPKEVAAPTLLIWGERDRYLGRRLTEGLEPWVPNLRVERMPDASHWVQEEYPERVNRLMIEFFRG